MIRFKFYLTFKIFSEQILCLSDLSGRIRIQPYIQEMKILDFTGFSDIGIGFSRGKWTMLDVCNMSSLTIGKY